MSSRNKGIRGGTWIVGVVLVVLAAVVLDDGVAGCDRSVSRDGATSGIPTGRSIGS